VVYFDVAPAADVAVDNLDFVLSVDVVVSFFDADEDDDGGISSSGITVVGKTDS
jgi:hypothetical protein